MKIGDRLLFIFLPSLLYFTEIMHLLCTNTPKFIVLSSAFEEQSLPTYDIVSQNSDTNSGLVCKVFFVEVTDCRLRFFTLEWKVWGLSLSWIIDSVPLDEVFYCHIYLSSPKSIHLQCTNGGLTSTNNWGQLPTYENLSPH